jgi:hypothetical protein
MANRLTGNAKVFTDAAYSSTPTSVSPNETWLLGDVDPTSSLPKAGKKGAGVARTVYSAENPFEPGISEEEQIRRARVLQKQDLDYRTDFSTKYYDDDDSKYNDPNAGVGAALTDIPTSTTNYKRPRTVAAGWSKDPSLENAGTLTVVFRDGTIYNFYEVVESDWIKFHASISKGRSYLNPANSRQASEGTLLKYRHGPADVSALPPDVRELAYRAARTGQIVNRTKFRYYYKDAAGNRKSKTVMGVRNKDIPGRNPSQKSGKNPAQKKP